MGFGAEKRLGDAGDIVGICDYFLSRYLLGILGLRFGMCFIFRQESWMGRVL